MFLAKSRDQQGTEIGRFPSIDEAKLHAGQYVDDSGNAAEITMEPGTPGYDGSVVTTWVKDGRESDWQKTSEEASKK